MANRDYVTFHIEAINLDKMQQEFRNATASRPKTSLKKLDLLFGAAGAAVRSRVHVETGRLMESGHESSHYLLDIWTGEITYRRYPGIFELARGDAPTRFHPTGGHFFFNAVEPFIPHMEDAVNHVFDEYFNEAPI